MSDREKVLNDLQELCEYLFHEYKVCYKGDEEDTYNRFLAANNALNLLKKLPQWHPFNPVEPDTDGLEDHNFYLVTVKGFGTPMKAMYHIDMPFGFTPPPTKDFDPYDVIAWRELPDNMNEEVKQ